MKDLGEISNCPQKTVALAGNFNQQNRADLPLVVVGGLFPTPIFKRMAERKFILF